MKYKTEELEKMSKEDLIKVYREAKTSLKKIPKSLKNASSINLKYSKYSLIINSPL